MELLHSIALLHNLTHKLVPADEVGWAFEVTAVEVEVAAAEGCAGDLEDGVGRVLELWVRTVFDDDLV